MIYARTRKGESWIHRFSEARFWGPKSFLFRFLRAREEAKKKGLISTTEKVIEA